MEAITVFAILYSKIKSISTGIKSVAYDSPTQSLKFECNDGVIFTVALPYPLSATEIQWIHDLSTTLEINTTTNDLEYNGEILNNIVFEQVKTSFPSIGNEKKLYIEINTDSLYRWDTVTNDYVKLGAGTTIDKFQKEITTPSITWTIQHNLDLEYWKLKISVIDIDGNVVYGNVDTTNTTKNLLVLNFDEPIQGNVYITK